MLPRRGSTAGTRPGGPRQPPRPPHVAGVGDDARRPGLLKAKVVGVLKVLRLLDKRFVLVVVNVATASAAALVPAVLILALVALLHPALQRQWAGDGPV